jgi:uncharacterized damage-inducible protein DinB
MSEITRIVDQLQRAHDGDPWHGSPITTNLRGVTAAQAAARPPGGAHSIWELVLHATAWRNEVRRRLTGERFSPVPLEGDWPAAGEPTEARWRAALRSLDEAHTELVKVVKTLPESRLFEPPAHRRDPAAGTGVTLYELLHGLAQHDAYHSGQVAIVKRVLGF